MGMYIKGEIVTILDGPFADFKGIVEEVDYEFSKLTLSVYIFGRTTPVELEFFQVEKESSVEQDVAAEETGIGHEVWSNVLFVGVCALVSGLGYYLGSKKNSSWV